MAVTSPCAELKGGQDISCTSPLRRFYQQAVIINKSDIDTTTVEITAPTTGGGTPTCAYNVQFSLKTGKTGYMFKGSENGSVYKGYFDKATNETFGVPDYTHHVQILLVGVSEETKCYLDALDKGSYVVAMQFADGTVEMYGFQSGMTTEDYTYDPQEGGGGTPIILSSREISPEPRVPLVYKSQVEGGETADFDSLFANDTP